MSDDLRHRPTLELRQLRYFVTLAQELNFRRAAERLHITQPSLSQQIALLEATLGVRLFERDRRQVSLTEAGQAILADAQGVLAESEMVLHKARQMASADSETLHVGLPEYANRTFIPDIAAAFRSQHPEVKVTITEGYSAALLSDLRRERLDVGFIRIPSAEDCGGLTRELMMDEKTGVLLATRHPLAACSAIPVAALAGEQFLVVDRPFNPALYDLIADWLQQCGVEPRFLKVGGAGVYTYDTMLRIVESGEALVLTARSVAIGGGLPAGVVFRPISGPSPRFQMAAVWSPSNTSPLLHEFLSTARELRGSNASVRQAGIAETTRAS